MLASGLLRHVLESRLPVTPSEHTLQDCRSEVLSQLSLAMMAGGFGKRPELGHDGRGVVAPADMLALYLEMDGEQ